MARVVDLKAVAETTATAKKLATSDDGIALSFAERFDGELAYVAAWSKWLLFDGQRWCTDDTRLAFSLARDVCREAAKRYKGGAALASAKTRAAVLSMASDDRRLALSADDFDGDPEAFNVPAKNRE